MKQRYTPIFLEVRKWFLFGFVIFNLSGILAGADCKGLNFDLRFGGVASGGVLIAFLFDGLPEGEARSVAVSTSPGESSESVGTRLCTELSTLPTFRYGRPSMYEGRLRPWTLLYFAGSETGLEIVAAPKSASVGDLSNPDLFRFLWENPEDGYGTVVISPGWARSRTAGESFCEVTRAYLKEKKGVDNSLRNTHLFFVPRKFDLNGVIMPVHVSAIYVSGRRQEELANLPFTGGIAPNWSVWPKAAPLGRGLEFLQGRKLSTEEGKIEGYDFSAWPLDNVTLRSAKTPDEKRYFQGVKTHGPRSGPGGIVRRFLGLAPGHQYRLYARLNTLESEKVKGKWSISIHAAAEDPSARGLTDEQLSGLARLPNGTQGEDAGLVGRFSSSGKHTSGQWTEVRTAAKKSGKTIADLTLPDGVTAITTWLRVQGNCETSLGMDWIALEDVTP